MKVLIVDDQEICRVVIEAALSGIGTECIQARNGTEAVSLFEEHRPDLVLLDIVMPVMDGYAAAPRIKELAGNQYVPIIFLTSHAEGEALQKCLECGGDDFLQKPVNPTILISKIQAHLRTQRLTKELQSKRSELEVLHATLRQEHETGQTVLAHSLARNLTNCKNIHSFCAPQSTFSGDMLLTARKPFGGLYVFLGDLTGHGLAAAIGTIPLSQVFFTMTKKAKPAASIIREMNRSLRNFLPRSMFCAAAFIELDATGFLAKVWCGGLPACFHLSEAQGAVRDVQSKHLPLGVLENESFNASLEEITFAEGDSLLLMTDGIPESVNSADEMFGLERVASIVHQQRNNVFSALLDEYKAFVEGASQEDDVSLLQVNAYIPQKEDVLTGELSSIPWTSSLYLDTDYLKRDSSIAAELFHMLPDRIEFAVQQETIATVVTELYSNALEHGILGLSSDMKESADGFEEYYLERRRRLDALQTGSIEVSLSYGREQLGELELVIKDSGSGFDKASVLNSNSQEPEAEPLFFGRGLRLIRSLCSELNFNERGNEAYARIQLVKS